MTWLVTWAYESERATAAIVEAGDEASARSRACEIVDADKSESRVIVEEAECHPVRDGLVVKTDAPY
jgi:hypothetical protein